MHWLQKVHAVRLLIKPIQRLIVAETLHIHHLIPFTIMEVHVFSLIVSLAWMDQLKIVSFFQRLRVHIVCIQLYIEIIKLMW